MFKNIDWKLEVELFAVSFLKFAIAVIVYLIIFSIASIVGVVLDVVLDGMGLAVTFPYILKYVMNFGILAIATYFLYEDINDKANNPRSC